MSSILDYQHFYLVGIKGVAMTSIAQCLIDAGKIVQGSDLSEDFVTHEQLSKLKLKIDHFDPDFLENNPQIDCLIYTAAHQGIDNPQVQMAIKAGIPIFSQAEALGSLFNQQQGIAVCGVGGKSSTSAMITWIFDQLKIPVSFSVGVGKIIGLEKTGAWNEKSDYFIAEADEYVIDPNALKKGQKVRPRFSFLKPAITVCTSLKFDHPDVYPDFKATKTAFEMFFLQLKDKGQLIINADNHDLVELAQKVIIKRPDIQLKTFSWSNPESDFYLANWQVKNGQSLAELKTKTGKNCQIRLQVPGQFNLMNALAAVAAAQAAGIKLVDSCHTLASFQSTQRRFELVKISQGKRFFDDYAHHPSEVSEIIRSLNQYFPQDKKVIAFQPHTYSRTKLLFNDFVDALGSNLNTQDELVVLDIFASAREAFDDSVSSEKLVAAIKAKFPQVKVAYLPTISELAKYLKQKNFDLAITLGAGDIYKLWQLPTSDII